MPNILLFINVHNNNFIVDLVQLQALFKRIALHRQIIWLR